MRPNWGASDSVRSTCRINHMPVGTLDESAAWRVRFRRRRREKGSLGDEEEFGGTAV